MALISPDLSGIVDGSTPGAAAWTTPMNTIINAINGNLDTNNFTINGTNLSTIASATPWTTWTPSPTGYSGSPTVNFARYYQVGKLVFLEVDFAGVSSATTLTYTLPVAARDSMVLGPCRIQDNGITSFSGLITLAAASTTATVTTSPVGGGWTASGAKGLYTRFFYEAA